MRSVINGTFLPNLVSVFTGRPNQIIIMFTWRKYETKKIETKMRVEPDLFEIYRSGEQNDVLSGRQLVRLSNFSKVIRARFN